MLFIFTVRKSPFFTLINNRKVKIAIPIIPQLFVPAFCCSVFLAISCFGFAVQIIQSKFKKIRICCLKTDSSKSNYNFIAFHVNEKHNDK